MSNCSKLFPADNVIAFYSAPLKLLVISAEVTVNPSDSVQICRSPLDPLLPPPAVPQFIVAGSTPSGIHTDLVMKRSISASFALDVKPAKIAVYSRGVDNPVRAEVTVGLPPAPITPAQTNAPQNTTTLAPVEATGWSTDFVLQEALANAITELRAAAGFRNPDVGLPFQVVAIGGQVGGFTLHTGVFVKVKSA